MSEAKQGARVVIFQNTKEIVRVALAPPLVVMASDGRIADGNGHPLGAATYAFWAKYVREDRSLMDAVRIAVFDADRSVPPTKIPAPTTSVLQNSEN
jgi:hypothetical protein